MRFDNFRGRLVDRSKDVWVYRNLNRRGPVPWYSVMQGGRVVAHATGLKLRDVRFVVRDAGRRRALLEGRKNVHAFAVGRLVPGITHPDETLRGMYTPSTGFVVEAPDGRICPVAVAAAVTFGPSGMFVHDPA